MDIALADKTAIIESIEQDYDGKFHVCVVVDDDPGRDVGLMRRQNDTFRKHARGKFASLLKASVKEPAVLIYLDAPANRKGHANENLARELMELFTLGVGNYSEKDVKEAARALTGWTVEDGQFAVKDSRHDSGAKTILGTVNPTRIDVHSGANTAAPTVAAVG